MAKGATIIDEWVEEGRIQTRQEDLRDLLTEKFGPLPEEVEARLTTTRSRARLSACLRRVLSARTLEEVGI